MSKSATAEQFELIDDDERKAVPHLGPFKVLRELREAREKHGELVTRAMACQILGVTGGHLGVWINRGRLTGIAIGPMHLVPAEEVVALYKQRRDEALPVGGRGHKMPPIAEFLYAGTKVHGQE